MSIKDVYFLIAEMTFVEKEYLYNNNKFIERRKYDV